MAPAILIVDDEPAIRALLRKVLGSDASPVLEASDGIEALDLLMKYGTEIALVLTDIDMPAMDGIALASAARALFPGILIVLMSGQTDPATLHPAWRGCDFIPKPFTPQTVLKVVRSVLARQPMLTRPIQHRIA